MTQDAEHSSGNEGETEERRTYLLFKFIVAIIANRSPPVTVRLSGELAGTHSAAQCDSHGYESFQIE